MALDDWVFFCRDMPSSQITVKALKNRGSERERSGVTEGDHLL